MCRIQLGVTLTRILEIGLTVPFRLGQLACNRRFVGDRRWWSSCSSGGGGPHDGQDRKTEGRLRRRIGLDER